MDIVGREKVRLSPAERRIVERMACVVLDDIVSVTELEACIGQAIERLDLTKDANRIAVAFAKDMLRDATDLSVGGLA